jgi:hypothetical protein
MTTKQRELYERALANAKRDMLAIVAHGTVKATGAALYCMPSRSQEGVWHVVTVDGLDLTCSCPAGKHGKYCCHRALVRCRLELEAQVRRDNREREVERAFHEAARELNVKLSALGPKPRDNVKPFSVFK